MATTVMGQSVSMPVIISPTGVQAVHPDGEVAVARAARQSGCRDGAQLLRQPIRRGGLCAVNDQVFFQMYWSGDRDTMLQRLDAGEERRRQGHHLDPGLVLRERTRLGQSLDPRQDRPEGGRASSAPEVGDATSMVLVVREDRPPARALDPQHGRARREAAHVLRCLLRVDAEPVAELGATWRGCALRGTARSW